MESERNGFLFWLGVDAVEDERAWMQAVRDGLPRFARDALEPKRSEVGEGVRLAEAA